MLYSLCSCGLKHEEEVATREGCRVGLPGSPRCVDATLHHHHETGKFSHSLSFCSPPLG